MTAWSTSARSATTATTPTTTRDTLVDLCGPPRLLTAIRPRGRKAVEICDDGIDNDGDDARQTARTTPTAARSPAATVRRRFRRDLRRRHRQRTATAVSSTCVETTPTATAIRPVACGGRGSATTACGQRSGDTLVDCADHPDCDGHPICCGGVVDSAEICDDGIDNDGDDCSSTSCQDAPRLRRPSGVWRAAARSATTAIDNDGDIARRLRGPPRAASPAAPAT